MNTIEPKTLKGFRDFLPDEARKRQYVINILKETFELFGFAPLETPALEYEEILTGKYGDEGDKLMYRFEDNGGRRVALRYDQTVPLSRVVAQYQNELTFPFKRYQIQPVWRAENTQKGRFREFLQCDVDIVGTTSPLADAEIVALVAKSLDRLGFPKFKILINDRANFVGYAPGIITSIDKLKKIGKEGVLQEMSDKGLPTESLDEILNKQMTARLSAIVTVLNDDRIVFDPTLARGLDYYTGLIMEVEIDGYTAGSVGGGGRYDDLIGMFAGRQIPAIGFAFGFDRLLDAMQTFDLFPKDLQTSNVLVTIFNPELQEKSLAVCSQLRSNNINTEIYLDEHAKMDKQLKYANQRNIPFVVIVGPDEVEKNVFQLKNMLTREQKEVSTDELIELLQ
jgi:histidyl-tRNA synthetase